VEKMKESGETEEGRERGEEQIDKRAGRGIKAAVYSRRRTFSFFIERAAMEN